MKQVLLKALNIIKAHIIQILQNSSNNIDPNKVGKFRLKTPFVMNVLCYIRIIHFYRMMRIHYFMDDFELMHRKLKY